MEDRLRRPGSSDRAQAARGTFKPVRGNVFRDNIVQAKEPCSSYLACLVFWHQSVLDIKLAWYQAVFKAQYQAVLGIKVTQMVS